MKFIEKPNKEQEYLLSNPKVRRPFCNEGKAFYRGMINRRRGLTRYMKLNENERCFLYVILKEYIKDEIGIYSMNEDGTIILPMDKSNTLKINAKGWYLMRIRAANEFKHKRRYGIMIFSYDDETIDDGRIAFHADPIKKHHRLSQPGGRVGVLTEARGYRGGCKLTISGRVAVINDTRDRHVIAKEYNISVDYVRHLKWKWKKKLETDRIQKGRMFNDEQIDYIRSSDKPIIKLAEEMGCSSGFIVDIRKREVYKDVK